MKIGFSDYYVGSGGARIWIKQFSKYCIKKGHTVSYGVDESVDVFCSVCRMSSKKDILFLKKKNIKILQRLGAIYMDFYGDKNIIDDLNKHYIFLNSNADEIVYQSKFSKEVLFRSIYNGNEPDGDIIYNCTDKEKFSPDGEKIAKTNDKKIILSIAYWCNEVYTDGFIKIMDKVLERFKDRKDIEFWILGKGYSRGIYNLYSNKYGNIAKFDLIFPINHEEMPKILRSADLFLNLKVHEPCPNLVIEALATGIPIVGLNCGSMPELLGDSALLAEASKDIRYFPDVDIDDLINKIEITLDNLSEYSQKILKRSEVFSEENTFEVYLNKLEKLYLNK